VTVSGAAPEVLLLASQNPSLSGFSESGFGISSARIS
jgi:hypothetical protein